MVLRLTTSGVLADDHLTRSVPAADANISVYESHANTMTACAEIHPGDFRAESITLTSVHGAQRACPAFSVSLRASL